MKYFSLQTRTALRKASRGIEAIALLLGFVIAFSVRAQVGAASLNGVVQDRTGAVIPGAPACLVNRETLGATTLVNHRMPLPNRATF